MKYIKTFENKLTTDKNIKIVYHISHSLEHMLKSDFKMEYANDGLYGKAIYFSESPNILYGTDYKRSYCCKFKITLDEPILDMNKEITNEEANKLLLVFNDKYKCEKVYDFNEEYKNVQYGEFFDEIVGWKYNKYLQDFIHNHLGYKSFVYYQDRFTNFSTEKTDYGRAYGVYDTTKIKYVDGPF